MDYFQTSAMQGDNVDEMMKHIIDKVFNRKLKPLIMKQNENNEENSSNNFKLGQPQPQ